MIQYLYFISYPIIYHKEVKNNKIKMFHIFQQTARVSLIKTTNIDKLVTIFKLLIHIFILTPESKVQPLLRKRFKGSYNYTFFMVRYFEMKDRYMSTMYVYFSYSRVLSLSSKCPVSARMYKNRHKRM